MGGEMGGDGLLTLLVFTMWLCWECCTYELLRAGHISPEYEQSTHRTAAVDYENNS
jgi:hypothetical protein